MKTLITTHANPDFDGFAASIAASLIYKNSIIVIAGNPSQNLKEFLQLYNLPYLNEKDFLKKYPNYELEVEKIVIVDTANINRIPVFIKEIIINNNDIKIDIYDHHPILRENNIIGNNYSKECGSAATIVLEKLLKEKNDFPDIYKTLFLIAIHEDTGNFIYTTTTYLDHIIAAELLKMGANLEEVEDFVSLEMTEDQKQIFDLLYNNISEFYVNDLNVYIAFAETEKFIGGLNIITHKIFETLTPDVLFSVVKMGKNIYIIARSKSDEIDLNVILKEFNGGGHKKAGAAKVKNGDANKIINDIRELMKKAFAPVLKAINIMSSPVRTVFENEKLEKIFEIMEQTGHSGLPVVSKNKLVGIVTKKDVEKAIKHKLKNAPVKAIMTKNLLVVDVFTPVSQIRKIMAESDVGRLPVLKDGVLIGIVTRSDILKATNGVFDFSINPIIEDHYDTFNIINLMKEKISNRVLNMLRLLGTYGTEFGVPVYVVGGFVRDLLLGVENLDIDLVVEGNGNEFGKYVADQLKIKYLSHEAFGTCSLFFKDGFKLDIATARTEYYEEPAKLPKVEISTIKKDLYRRDFSINAMAIKLNPEKFGLLLDFFGCKKDLDNGIIRALYSLSFVEDPTRILRAIRFEQRFNFKIDENTLDYMERTIENNYLEKVTGTRLREEIEKIIKEKSPINGIKRLGKLKIISHLFPYTYYTPTLENEIIKMFAFYDLLNKENKKYIENTNKFYILLYVILQYTSIDVLEFIRVKYGLPKNFVEKLVDVKNVFNKINKEDIKFSEIYELTKKFNNEQIIFLASKISDKMREHFYKYLKKLSNIKLPLNGKDLKKMGYVRNEIGIKLDELTKIELDK
ncbi:tRNA nucleotidyltransferase [Tepiditoga spiralis]|uniref:tRNA nucleotidyltransferase n=1 Tax=Tepiditoga spiralis TaxID=2108365 RepID=A0A7G1G603_9BACT|nr:CBS domain-containing protein [Tepiditoga spiralis]BBE30766.1 tRNA nucleotidyltransferase [Tepiditoga spiralis]